MGALPKIAVTTFPSPDELAEQDSAKSSFRDDDGLRLVKGIAFGAAICLPFWIAVFLFVRHWLHS